MKKNVKKCLLAVAFLATAAIGFAACKPNEDQPADHTHTFKQSWSTDSEYHWHDADCGHDVVDGKAEHSFTSSVTQEATCTVAGVRTYTCTCGYSYTEEIPVTEHTFDTENWTYDEENHWHAATCGCSERIDEAKHTIISGACSVCKVNINDLIAETYVFVEDGSYYSIKGLTEKGKTRTALSIPATYNGKKVTSIEREAFYGDTALESVVIPSGITEIKQATFAGCSSLNHVELPATITSIAASAFDGCAALEEITLPENLTTLGKQAFANCTSLKTITIPSGITLIDDNAFLKCSSLETVTLPAGIQRIGIQAFARCTSLKTISLPDDLSAIGMSAFQGSGLTEITVPDTVNELGASAFAKCASLTAATLSKGLNYHFGKIFAECEALEEITIPFVGSNVSESDAVTTEFGYLFGLDVPQNESAYTKVGNYYVPNSLVSVTVLGGTIAEGAFNGCSHVQTVNVTAGVVLGATEFTNSTAVIHVLGAPTLAGFEVAESAYVNEEMALTYKATYGSEITVTVQKGTEDAVLGTDYELNAGKTQITFKAEGTFKVTVTATLNDETATKTANIEVAYRAPELTASVNTNEIDMGETVVLTYTIDNESNVEITVKKGDVAAVSGTDYTYAEDTKTFTFITAGTYTITVAATRNGKNDRKEFTIAVADTTYAAPVVTLEAAQASVEEGTAVTLTASVVYDTENGDEKSKEEYEVFVQNGSSFENAAESLYEFNSDYTSFTPKVAGTYQIKLTANSVHGRAGNATATVTATVATIALEWADVEKTGSWLRMLPAGGDIEYTVSGYTGGYTFAYSVDNANVSVSEASGKTALSVAATASDTAIVKITYTHKSDATIKQEIEMPVSFVEDLVNAPVFGADPFGGTYGTLIPSTGLMLYFSATDKNGTALTYDDITYEVVETDLLNSDGAPVTSVTINKLYDMTDYPFILVENFENNTATGTVTVKLTATKDGATASSTKVFTVTPLEKDAKGEKNVKGLNEYAGHVMDRGNLDFDIITDFDQRQNMVLSKEGAVYHRKYGSGALFAVSPENDNFQLDFEYTPFARTGSEKVSFAVNFRMGDWNSWNDKQSAFYAENGAETITAGYWGPGTVSQGADKPTVEYGTVIYVRFTHTRSSNDGATFTWKWSSDGETYHDWLTYTVAHSTSNGNMGAKINAMQFGYEDGSFRIGNVKLSTLNA